MLPILLLMVFLPFLAIIPITLLSERSGHKISLVISLVVLVLAILAVVIASQSGAAVLSFSQGYIGSIGINLEFQLTSLTTILVVMTAIVFFAASLVNSYFITKDQRLYSVIFMLVEGGAIGIFLSANLFLFYVFWEIAEFAMFFIIFGFGGYDRRYAAIKFIIYSIVASLLLLVAIMLLYYSVTPHTFNILQLEHAASKIPVGMQPIITLLLLVAFMIKAPVFPFHNWLPDAHTEAPTTGSMILAGVLLKFGGYGLILMFLMVPFAAHYASYIAVVFGFSAIYGALVALRQTHLKRMIAYTSIVDMGIIAVAIAAVSSFGTTGALYGMLSHALAISLLFLVAGTIERVYGTLIIEKLKGISESAPKLAYLFIFGALAVIGLPLTAGFVGDLLIFIGAYGSFGVIGLIPLAAILLVGAYLFWVIEKSFLNVNQKSERYNVLERPIVYAGLLLAASTVILGIFPSVLLTILGL